MSKFLPFGECFVNFLILKFQKFQIYFVLFCLPDEMSFTF